MSDARWTTAPVYLAREPQAWREAKPKRSHHKFRLPVAQYKRDVSRVPTDHQAPSQEAVTTAITRNLRGTAAPRPRRSKSL